MKPDRKCCTCREVKPAGEFSSPRARSCMGCHESKALASCRPCLQCHVRKAADEFAWGDGTHGRGTYRRRKGICLACEAERREAKAKRASRRSTWEQDGVLVRRCAKCGEVKPLEAGFFVAKQSTGLERWRYWCKSCDNERSREYKARVSGTAEQRAKFREWKRDWVQRNPEKARAAQKRYRERRKADPARYAASLESARIQYRLRQERKGRSLGEVRALPVREAPRSTVGSLLAAPLVAAVDSYVRRNNLIEMAFCEANGLSPKNLSDWRAGRRVRVQYAVADRTLVAMGLNWWDVWDENDPEVRQVWEGDMRAAA